MRITDELLEKHEACEDQRELFRKLYPNGAETTAEELVRAARAGLTISWLERFIPAPAQKAYDEAFATALKAYNEAVAPDLKAYNEALASARKAYKEAHAQAWKAYKEATAPALKAYDETTAQALAVALWGK